MKEDARTPLFSMISRMDYQKGVDLLPEALHRLSERPENAASDWQMVILGTGDLALEAAVRGLEQDFPGRVRAVTRFDAAAQPSHLRRGGYLADPLPLRAMRHDADDRHALRLRAARQGNRRAARYGAGHPAGRG